MPNTAIFARHTHPESQGGHSYSIVIVQYDTKKQLEALEQMLGCLGAGLPEPLGHTYQWYRGKNFDLIATFPTAPDTITPFNYKLNEDMTKNKHSVGDHRWIGYYTADELLKEE